MLMTKAEMQAIASKAMYWHEVMRRDCRGHIMRDELAVECDYFGERLLLILADYAKLKLEELNKEKTDA